MTTPAAHSRSPEALSGHRFALVGVWVEERAGEPARQCLSTANTPAVQPRAATAYSPAMGGCASALDIMRGVAQARVASGDAITASVRLYDLDGASRVVEIFDGMDAARAAMWDD